MHTPPSPCVRPLARLAPLAVALAAAGPVAAQEPSTLASVASTPTASDGPPAVDRLYWNGDLRFESEDKEFMTRIGGRINLDFIHTDDGDQSTDGAKFRRAHLDLHGRAWRNVDWRFQLELRDGDVRIFDVWTRYNELIGPLYLKVGHFFQPMGLDVNTSIEATIAIDRDPTEDLLPERQTGFMTGSAFADDAGTWAASIFNNDSDSFGNAEGGHWEGALRGTYRFDLDESDTSFMHFGASASTGSSRDGLRFRAYPGANRGAFLVDSGAVPSDGIERFGLEWAGVFGAFSAQAEWMKTTLGGTGGGSDTTLDGAYAQVSWFATGESRNYRRGAFGPVSPKSPWRGWGDGTGALELIARFTMLDFSEAPTAEEGEFFGVGANWYLNANSRIMFNYNIAERDDPSGTTDLDNFVLRFQTRF